MLTLTDKQRERLTTLKVFGANFTHTFLKGAIIDITKPKGILDYELDMFIAGGSFSSVWHDEIPRDIDVYVLNRPKAQLELNLNVFDSLRTTDETNPYNHSKHIVSVGTLKEKYKWSRSPVSVQIIFTKHNTRKEVLEEFDMVHCRMSHALGKLYFTESTLKAIENKMAISYNGHTVEKYRCDRLKARGWDVCGAIEPETVNGPF